MKRILFMFFISTLILAGCTNSNQTNQEIYTHLEEAVQLESEFQEAQSELIQAEEEEAALYNEMIEINMDQLDEVQEKAERATELTERRKELIEQEMQSINVSKEEFDQIIPLIDELSDEEAQEQAQLMVTTMEERYEAFVTLYETYLASIESDQALYTMLMDESLDKETLDAQVDEINAMYEQINEHQELFNERTHQFNEQKRTFYDVIELEVEYQE